MPTVNKKATSRKASKPIISRSATRKPIKQAPPAPTALQIAVAELRSMGATKHIEDTFENLVAYAIMSEDFHRENEFVPRFNYVTVAKYARRIVVAALLEVPDIDPDPDQE